MVLLLYGPFDEERRLFGRELIEFCRDQSAMSLYRTELEIEPYLRCFQLPPPKQRDITVVQRDFIL
jgi:hypothetical protein